MMVSRSPWKSYAQFSTICSRNWLAFMFGFLDGRAELLYRDRADASDEVRDALEHLVDVLMRVVDEEVVVLEPDFDALLIHRDLDENLLHREHDLIFILVQLSAWI